MVDIKHRLCGQSFTVTDQTGLSFTIERGREYTTTANVGADGKVMVFSTYWVNVPVSIFFEKDSAKDY